MFMMDKDVRELDKIHRGDNFVTRMKVDRIIFDRNEFVYFK